VIRGLRWALEHVLSMLASGDSVETSEACQRSLLRFATETHSVAILTCLGDLDRLDF
jgi:hypothetical protein